MVRVAPTAPIENMNIAMMNANVNFAAHLLMDRAVLIVQLANTAMAQAQTSVFGVAQRVMALDAPIVRLGNTKSRRI